MAGPGAAVQVRAWIAKVVGRSNGGACQSQSSAAGGDGFEPPEQAAIVASRANVSSARVSTGFGAPEVFDVSRGPRTHYQRCGPWPFASAMLVYRVAAAVPEGCVPVL